MENKLTELQYALASSVATVRQSQSAYSFSSVLNAQIGLVPSMRQQLSEVESVHGMTTHFSIDLPEQPLPTPITKAVFQIFTETVLNAGQTF